MLGIFSLGLHLRSVSDCKCIDYRRHGRAVGRVALPRMLSASAHYRRCERTRSNMDCRFLLLCTSLPVLRLRAAYAVRRIFRLSAFMDRERMGPRHSTHSQQCDVRRHGLATGTPLRPGCNRQRTLFVACALRRTQSRRHGNLYICDIPGIQIRKNCGKRLTTA